jgi:transmembrane sensor
MSMNAMKHDLYTADDFLLDNSFVAYRQGTDSAAAAYWTEWQRRQPANLPAFREAEQLHSLISGHKPGLEASFQELKTLLAERQADTGTPVVDFQPSRTRFQTGWWIAAASLFLVMGLAGYWLWQNQTVSYRTEYAQQKTITLPDGSSVTLNSHSELSHRRHWAPGEDRDVTLTGEGYFSVRHLEAGVPFRVHSEGAFSVQVLGTEFTMTSRSDLNRVVLNRGKVQVSGSARTAALTLEPGQLAELDPTTGQLTRRNVSADRYNGWLRNQLVFDEVTLSEAVRQVQEQFGVDVRFDSVKVGNRRFSGILPLKDPGKALSTLAVYHQLKVIRQGDAYLLSR